MTHRADLSTAGGEAEILDSRLRGNDTLWVPAGMILLPALLRS